jgi:SNF2 family DNA or RNA helicase
MDTEEFHIPLLPHQEQGKQFILTHPFCGLFLDMGLGKTLTTLAALYDINPTGHVLVIAPKNIARSTWIDEIEKWKIPIRWKSFIVNEKGKDLPKAKRLELYDSIANSPPTVWFINRELLCDLIDHMPKVKNESGKSVPLWRFPYVVIDEFQSFKSYDSKRFKALKSVRPQIQRLIGLTGTPAPNGIEDLWSEIYLLDMGQRLGPNITSFRNEYMYSTFVVNGHAVGWQPKAGAEEIVYNKIKDVAMSLQNTTMQIPDMTFNYVNVYMNDKERKTYQKLAKTSVLNVNGEDVMASNAAVLVGKLSQMASGALYTDDKHNYVRIHEHKLEHCEYIINNTSDNVLIAYHFQSDKEMLMEYFSRKSVGIQAEVFDGTKDMIDRWNNRQIPVMLVQPASAGHGLNIQFGGHTLIWYTLPWSLEEYLQCNARLHRQGQKDPVIIHHLVCSGTVDEHILKALEHKDVSQQALISAVDMTVRDLDT